MPTADEDKRKAARETIDILHEISTLLYDSGQWMLTTFKNTNLDRHTLSYCVSLIENGVNPEALANVVVDLRAQSKRLQAEGANVT
ncbi:uncharacterized protein LTR77_006554 [Saxophila tyrrhenica]|uniref:Mitotic-spindle organizing protein 1 n=1 Tax=Saxophila tyrrhenica TaxID=1690608 RepID=A0AAV9P567_9PEZI|nr:hypothetical protein LTR77_006554 [Saxophila tyrrhenica]